MPTVKASVEAIAKKNNFSLAQKRYILGNLKLARVEASDEADARTANIIRKLADKMRRNANVTRAVDEAKLGSFDENIQQGIDPLTGDKLVAVLLAKGRRAYYNPDTRVTYPLPNLDNLKAKLEEV